MRKQKWRPVVRLAPVGGSRPVSAEREGDERKLVWKSDVRERGWCSRKGDRFATHGVFPEPRRKGDIERKTGMGRERKLRAPDGLKLERSGS